MKTTSNLHPLTVGQPWAIFEPALRDLVSLDALGPDVRAKLEAAVNGRQAPRQAATTIAIIRIRGVISLESDLFSLFFGGTSVEFIRAELRQALADPAITGIVLDIHSPGGSVYGPNELAAEILAARGKKPIVAFTAGMMASAAYWIGAAADRIVATPSAEVGCIGVVMVHQEVSKLEAEMGITTTVIKVPDTKMDLNEHEPLSSETIAALKGRAGAYYAMFAKAIARGRKVPIEDVRSGFGQGLLIGAQASVSAQMIDATGTLDDVILDIAKGRVTSSQAAAMAAAAVDDDFTFRAKAELELLGV